MGDVHECLAPTVVNASHSHIFVPGQIVAAIVVDDEVHVAGQLHRPPYVFCMPRQHQLCPRRRAAAFVQPWHWWQAAVLVEEGPGDWHSALPDNTEKSEEARSKRNLYFLNLST
jgi:hypothetical protein